jgi:large subunit ribosomal protein L9
VADGYGRNYLLPHSMAVLATPGALNQSEKIREEANKQRAIINKEMDVIAERLKGVVLSFAAKAGETGKMYGSITTQDIATALQNKTGVEIKRYQIDMQPLRVLGEHKAHIRLTMDLVPDIKVVIYREGEANPTEAAAPTAKHAAAPVEPVTIEPVTIEPVTIEPVTIEPLAAETAPAAPVAQEQAPVAVEAAPEEVAPTAPEETHDTAEA